MMRQLKVMREGIRNNSFFLPCLILKVGKLYTKIWKRKRVKNQASILPSLTASRRIHGDAPFLVRTSASCYSFLVQTTLISPLSLLSRMADISTRRRLS